MRCDGRRGPREYVLHVDEPDGTTTRHHLVAVLEFGAGRLSGERLYAGDALLRMMFGPVLG